MHSAEAFRSWLISDPIPRFADSRPVEGYIRFTLHILWTGNEPRQSRSSSGTLYTFGCSRCPIRQGLETGGRFPVGLLPFRLLIMGFLSQAWRLGGLPRASPVPFRASYFTPGVHPPGATAQGLTAYLYKRWSFPLIASVRFVAHQGHQPNHMP